MSHPTFQDLTEAVHGLRPPLAHVEDCTDCRRTADALRRELALLRRADARLGVPVAGRRTARWLPLTLAAGALLAITSWIVLGPPAVEIRGPGQERPAGIEDLVVSFLDGEPEASSLSREALAKRPSEALPALLKARRAQRPTRRPEALCDFILVLKEQEAGPELKGHFERLKSVRITIEMKDTPLSGILDYVREISGIMFQADPELDCDRIMLNFKVTDVRLDQALDLMGMTNSFEWDVRYGAIFVARPDRMLTLPRLGRWRTQEKSEAAKAIVQKLGRMKLDLSFEKSELEDLLFFIRDASGINLILDPTVKAELDPKTPVTFKAKDTPLSSILDGLLLPRGLDARIESNAISVYRPKN
ncbi:MAG TPA: hypothetical protein VG457_12150 [Planctomycetota bacterium]|jgi:hypothetical protein|nr:hypothetical protein [Planctomycetota bacterium]